MGRLELALLRRRFAREYSYEASTFSYRTIAAPMATHVAELRDFARSLDTERLHFVGHSLGGIVILRLLESTDDLPDGRAVLLGSPLQGSQAAQGLKKIPLGTALLGHAINNDVLASGPRTWSGRRDVGVIAGSSGRGLGRIFADLPGEHDGTVLVEETMLPGAKDHITMPVSHTGLIFSSAVARQADCFLRTGAFEK
jgi:pimeloyl-ACP methyl ester carboxylesterase